VDSDTIRWLLGGAVSVILGLIGFLFKRQSDQATDAAQSRAKQWDAINKLRDDLHDLERRMLESMATKQDLREMETRITAAITAALTQLEHRR
jgi:hypothetical protein